MAAADFPVVGVCASAGGAEACGKLLAALPEKSGMAFIVILHPDASREGMGAQTLALGATMTVLEAADGLPIEPDHLYVVPAGAYPSIKGGALHLSTRAIHHRTRLPFDFLLRAIASEYGERAVAVALSGNGADGSLGVMSVRQAGGLVVAQDPEEAAHQAMPRNVIMTGAAHFVLPVGEIAESLVRHGESLGRDRKNGSAEVKARDPLSEIIELLHVATTNDFSLYKRGTLNRRIERRMATLVPPVSEMSRYLDLLRKDSEELDLLARDLLINVTSFFRDAAVFELLSARIVPELIRKHSPDRAIRVWVAGCSTGEEAYSLAMLFREKIAEANVKMELHVFASDADEQAVAFAREGLYSESIEETVSPARLERFFTREGKGWRVLPELRASVIFTVQNVLSDPPFSRVDLLSCRNVLIYLAPEAQERVISLFGFALRHDGVLVLGSGETVGNLEDHFDPISRAARIYRRVGQRRPAGLEFAANPPPATVKVGSAPVRGAGVLRQDTLADLSKRIVLENYAPAAVLVNRAYEFLYALGPAYRYLQVAPGHATHDLFAMIPKALGSKVRSAVHRATEERKPIVARGGRVEHGGVAVSFNIHVEPLSLEGEELFLICFVNEPKREEKSARPLLPAEATRVAELERELDETRTELQGAIRDLEIASDEQKAIAAEALSLNEEYQSTNEQLVTSKEELQSLNEELTALNAQLQESLERQRAMSNDLQNVLYSTDVAMLFLDSELNIRSFTPAIRSLFNILPGDVGRPIADLSSPAIADTLLADARAVLGRGKAPERYINARSGAWYIQRMLPYRTPDGAIAGVVITFIDNTEQMKAAEAQEVAKREAELANAAKSRFLAAASHDLRQPLQTLKLLHGLLEVTIEGERARTLLSRFEETLVSMSGILDALLDINQIEAGTLRVELTDFPVNDLLLRMRKEFAYAAHAQGLSLHVVGSSLAVRTDPRLFEQMVRNLLSNAMKYTKSGSILLGCRRHKESLTIEVWDTGIGIPSNELDAIFAEYHQLNAGAGEHGHSLGLGLSIVKRLGDLLGHGIFVRSQLGKGSVFAIEAALAQREAATPAPAPAAIEHAFGDIGVIPSVTSILLIEDEPDVRDLLKIALEDQGHRVMAVSNGFEALDLLRRGVARPGLILADYNLSQGMDGLQTIMKFREALHRELPAIILTGDITTGALQRLANHDLVHLSKPVRLREVTETIQQLLKKAPTREAQRQEVLEKAAVESIAGLLFVVDDDRSIRDSIRDIFEGQGWSVETYETCEAFLDAYEPDREGCLLVDAYLPGMSGLELLGILEEAGRRPPAIMITGNSDVQMAVKAMKAGASDFIEKPIGYNDLIASVERAVGQFRDTHKQVSSHDMIRKQLASLTPRQQEIMELVLAGQPSKIIAANLGISQRTVENHRAVIMKKTGAKSLPALVRLVLAVRE
ncbi:CheR family methyltransferase [Rhizobium sp. BK251]|uniref:CheR family methyltransferase n=1 Tax=Rhizobium sp. BK251 TaxID=2512125 RepID=UPI001FE09B88|nr:CheR family methyltransferase [Rhizobium sp. BK251]